jgi:hypothetical protein
MTDLFMEREAVISDCGRYRYLLRRAWDHDKPRALFVMLNPSTADATVDDATIRSCIRLSRGFGYGSFEVVNLFSWRATDPKDLAASPTPIGSEQYGITDAAIARCDIPICAWGAHPMANGHGRRMVEQISASRPAAFCLGKTKAGEPKHPLYIKSGTPLEVYRP